MVGNVQWASGRYASYWNAFLLGLLFWKVDISYHRDEANIVMELNTGKFGKLQGCRVRILDSLYDNHLELLLFALAAIHSMGDNSEFEF